MMRSQSAMEYLMTYGWAILVIAVVLGAIYSLGLFNAATLGPKAQPGACQVIRPGGPLSTQYVSLAGSCTNELPQYVAQFGGAGSSYVDVGNAPSISPTAAQTVTLWFDDATPINDMILIGFTGPHNTLGVYGSLNGCSAATCEYTYWQTVGTPGGYELNVQPPNFKYNKFNFMALTYNSTTGNGIVYINGAAAGSYMFGGAIQVPNGYHVTIGARNGGTNLNFNGTISNVQVYNSTLDANSINALYLEGIGGAPINLQSLVGWWPLNGNANDYSGNGNNGQAYNVIFTNQWLSSYSIP